MSESKYDELVSNLTQEIANKGDEIPEKFLIKEGEVIPPSIDPSPTFWEENLIIDFSLISSKSSCDPLVQKELAKVRSALGQWGCFQIINHGMASLVEEVLDVTKQFFALPLEERLKSALPDRFIGGYGNLKNENWFDQLFLFSYPESQRELHYWPTKPDNFRELALEYGSKIMMLSEEVFKAMARSLELKEDSFLKQQAENPTMDLKFGIYPHCSRPDRVYGAGPHSDPVTLTILLPDDEVWGLEILKDDQWYKVPVKPGALFINLGDVGSVMSNGIFKSVVHRVVTHPEKDRYSVASFFMPGPKGEVGPINELITDTTPQVYKKVDLPGYRKILQDMDRGVAKALDALKLEHHAIG